MEYPDPIESCPYNITHRIRRSRMQFHVTTCAQNHKHSGMLQCPFDARHVIKRIDFEHHKSTCPGRKLVIDYAIHDATSQAKLKVLPIDVNPVGRWDEKWDDGVDVKTYDPIQNIKNKPIVYALIGVSRSKRKNHRMQERIRYNKVMENKEINMLQNSFYSASMNTSSKLNTPLEVANEFGDSMNEQGYKPLRPPKKFLAARSTDETVDEVISQTSEPPVCMDRETSSTLSQIDETSNYSSSSVSVSSNNQRNIFSKKSSEDCWMFEESSPRVIDTTPANENDQEKYSIPDSNSIVSNKDEYQFYPYKYNNQDKYSMPDAISIVSKDDYQFCPCQDNDQEKYSIPDGVSVVSSRDEYQFNSYQHKDQGKSSNSDAVSIIFSMDEYQFNTYQYKNQDKSSNSDSVSVVSTRDDYQFYPYQYEDRGKSSSPDSDHVIVNRNEDTFYPYHHKDQEKFFIPDTASITFSKDEYEVSVPFVHMSSEKSLTSSNHETPEIDPAFSYVEDDSTVHTLSKKTEEVTENDKDNNNFPITDIVYNISSGDESQYVMTPVNWNPGISSLPSEIKSTSSESLNYKTAQSSNDSMNSIKSKTIEDVSIFDKLSKKIEEIVINGKGHQEKSESLIKKIDMLKKLPSNKNSRKNSIIIDSNKGKLFPKCAANFLNLKS